MCHESFRVNHDEFEAQLLIADLSLAKASLNLTKSLLYCIPTVLLIVCIRPNAVFHLKQCVSNLSVPQLEGVLGSLIPLLGDQVQGLTPQAAKAFGDTVPVLIQIITGQADQHTFKR